MRKDRDHQERPEEGSEAVQTVGTAAALIGQPLCFVHRSIERQPQIAALLRKSAEHFEVTQ